MKKTGVLKPENVKSFFLVGPLGFETTMADELARVQPWILGADGRPTPNSIRIVAQRKGGLEIQAPWLEGLQLVHHLKTPVRMLYRWKSKKMTHVSELKSWLRSQRPLELIPQDFKLKIQSRKSKLQNEKMIERVFHEDWRMIQEDSAQTLYVDVYNDQFTLSWDVGGEPLYKRSWSTRKGVAPLRENLAAALLQDLIGDLTGPELSQMSLMDPMMGSGTFLWEAAGILRLNTDRSFAYQSWKGLPGFLKTSWWTNLNRPEAFLWKNLYGSDRDPKMVQAAQENSKAFTSLQLGRNLFLKQEDVLSSDSVGTTDPLLMISNPPYGERLAVDSVEKLLTAALVKYKPFKALFVVPQSPLFQVEGYKTKLVRKFLQGGLEVQAVLFLSSC